MNDELKDRDFNRKLDHFLTTNTMTAEDYATLTPRQIDVIQCIKRALARLPKHDN